MRTKRCWIEGEMSFISRMKDKRLLNRGGNVLQEPDEGQKAG
ncbi:hypothetical protein [Desertibacillus haloalkaliphilus]|nr:hypothetical protein [Desertibacillus haloalkaliphilus]